MIIVKTIDELQTARFQIQEELKENSYFGFDLETNGVDPHSSRILLVSLATTKNTYVFDLTLLGEKAIHYFRSWLESRNYTKIIQNAVFEWKMLYQLGINVVGMWCTMVTDQLIYAGLEFNFSLDEVSIRNNGYIVSKDLQKSFIGQVEGISNEQYEYSGLDAEVLLLIYRTQREKIADKDLMDVHYVEMELISTTAMMEYVGIKVDKDLLRNALPKINGIIEDVDLWFQDYVLEEGLADSILITREGVSVINTSSNKQMLELLHKIGVKVPSLSKKDLVEWDGKWSTKNKVEVYDDDFIIPYNHPILRKHAIRIAASKLKSTYYEGILNAINPVTQSIHPRFNQCGAARTGRYSSSGPNFQNIPSTYKISALGLGEEYDIRSAFVARPGMRFVISDFSGIELVILGAFSGDHNLITQQKAGDLHSYVGRNIFNVSEEDWDRKKEPYKTLRNIAKTVTYAIMYGTTAMNLFRTAAGSLQAVGRKITLEDAEGWLHTWKNVLFPETGRFLNENSNHAVTRYYTTSVLGRRRNWTPEIREDRWKFLAAQREGSNHPIQASSADMTKLAMIHITRKLNWKDAYIVATIHDEIIVECREGIAEEVAILVKEEMEGAGYALFPELEKGMVIAEPKISTKYDK